VLKLIVAHGHNGEIGSNNQLLWHLPKDLAMFKVKTQRDTVLMGRLTFESLPFSQGLPNRQNYVVSDTPRKSAVTAPVVWMNSIPSAISVHNMWGEDKDLWIIGGATVYKQGETMVDEIHVTEVHEMFPDADTYYIPDLTKFYEDVGQRQDVSSPQIRATAKVYLRK
tara:strand:- start:184 stop:684 length:501 start_codon:yes stop_codon:yes gene_type:complete